MNIWDELEKHRYFEINPWTTGTNKEVVAAIERGRALEQALKVAREALEFYGSDDNWHVQVRRNALEDTETYFPAEEDRGRVSVAALAEIRRMGGE